MQQVVATASRSRHGFDPLRGGRADILVSADEPRHAIEVGAAREHCDIGARVRLYPAIERAFVIERILVELTEAPVERLVRNPPAS